MSDEEKIELLEAEVLRLRGAIRDYCREAGAGAKKLRHDVRMAYLQSIAAWLGILVGWAIATWCSR